MPAAGAEGGVCAHSLVSLYVIEYICLGQVKPIENGGLLGILNMHTLTLKLNCFSFSVLR